MPPMKICFAGTPSFAADHLAALVDTDHEILAVYTQPDRPAGRGKKLLPSPVKQVALENDLSVYQPATLKSNEAQDELASFKPDLLIVVAYGLILPQQVLDIPRYGCINVHASLLPRWRGAAPVERATVEAALDRSDQGRLDQAAQECTRQIGLRARRELPRRARGGARRARLGRVGNEPC